MRDLAQQAGLSEATVDRVLHHRPGVSARAVRAVEQAGLELDRQQSQVRLAGRPIIVDVVMQAPSRFSGAVREALETELPGLRPAAMRARFDLREQADVAAAVAAIDAVGRGGRVSHGLLLKAPDEPEVAAAVQRLSARGIPVVTLVTDVRDSGRVAYVGLDNGAAGRTAAYLMSRWVPRARPGTVLLTMSRAEFRGEWERASAFREALATGAPDLRVKEVADADGLDDAMAARVAEAIGGEDLVLGVYSVGGGNRAIVRELERAGAQAVVIGHDLDADNVELLRTGRLDVVLHHDLRADMRAALRQILRHHRLLPGAPTSVLASVQVVTPHSIPARLAPT